MAAVRWKVEHQHRYPSVETGHDYYWTSVYYYNNFNSDPAAGPNWNALLDATYGASTFANKLVSIRINDVQSNTFYGIATPMVNSGLLPEVEGGSLINVIRLTGRVANGRPSYKLWRPPLMLADIDGSYLSDGMWSVVQEVLLPSLNEAQLISVSGNPILEWTADRLIHMWQIRHGTKRRERVVYAYP